MEDWWKHVTTIEPKPIDLLVTKCLICGEDTPVYSIDDSPKICGSCQEAVMWARRKMKQGDK